MKTTWHNKSCFLILLVLSGVVLITAGCTSDSKVEKPAAQKSHYDGSRFLLNAEPDGGQEIIAARELAENDDDIVLIGRIGGSLNPWVEGRAAFSVVDSSMLACSDDKGDDEPCSCKTPWDYCCESDKLPGAMAFIKFVEEDGTVVKHDARAVFGLKELETVVVKGKAQRDDAGNLTILAHSMFVRE